jgi:hypothetical protein
MTTDTPGYDDAGGGCSMKPRSARKQFLLVVEKAGKSLARLTPAEGVALMLDFYRDERAEGCPIDEDGDMLLFQWGTYDWGEGTRFAVDITRQFIREGDGSDDFIRQLSLRFLFAPPDGTRALSSGNRWCTVPDGLEEFRSFIDSSPVWPAIDSQNPTKVVLQFGGV